MNEFQGITDEALFDALRLASENPKADRLIDEIERRFLCVALDKVAMQEELTVIRQRMKEGELALARAREFLPQ
jgi:hypothetical protein